MPLDLWAKIALNVAIGVALSVLVAAALLRAPVLTALLGQRRNLDTRTHGRLAGRPAVVS